MTAYARPIFDERPACVIGSLLKRFLKDCWPNLHPKIKLTMSADTWLVMDGEVLPFERVFAEIQPGLCRVMIAPSISSSSWNWEVYPNESLPVFIRMPLECKTRSTGLQACYSISKLVTSDLNVNEVYYYSSKLWFGHSATFSPSAADYGHTLFGQELFKDFCPNNSAFSVHCFQKVGTGLTWAFEDSIDMSEWLEGLQHICISQCN